jgi:integrin alpha FG-GAP repeat containing protein 1
MVILSTDHSTNTSTTNYLEIWRGLIEGETIKYCLTKSNVMELDPHLGLFSLADINRDSLLDIIFPIKDTNPPKLLIAYNKSPFSYEWTDDYCATHMPLSNANSTELKITHVFEQGLKPDKKSNFIQTIYLGTKTEKSWYSNENIPIYLRFGDFNKDSYPDFTTVIYDKTDQSQTAYIFINSIGNKDNIQDYKSFERSFFSESGYEIIMTEIGSAYYSSFIDLDENGSLDLMVAYSENGKTVKTAGFYSTYNFDSFFLKSLVHVEPGVYISNELGTTFRFITTNIDGSRRMDVASQAIQASTPLSLNLPYTFIGIGRSNNYIENFCVISGNYMSLTDNYHVFTPVIPNSQLIIKHEKTVNSKSYESTTTNKTIITTYTNDTFVENNNSTQGNETQNVNITSSSNNTQSQTIVNTYTYPVVKTIAISNITT